MPIIIIEQEIEAQEVSQLTQGFRDNKQLKLQNY